MTNNFILSGNNTWENQNAAYGTPNNIFEITVKECPSRFSYCKDTGTKYAVVIDGINDKSYRAQLIIKLFDNQRNATDFTEKLVRLLNEEEEL